MRSSRLRPIAAVAAVIAMVAVGSCARGPVPSHSAAEPPPAATVVPLPTALTAADVEARNRQVTDLRTHSSISYPTLPTDPTLQDALQAAIDSARTAHTEDTQQAGGLFVTWQIAAAAGSVLGVRVQTSSPASTDGEAMSSTTWYSDARSQHIWLSKDLIRPQALPSIATAALAAVRAAGLVTGTPTVDASALVHDVVFDRTGALILTLPEGAIAPQARGRIAVQLSATLTQTALSATGRTVQDVLTSGAPIMRALPVGTTAAPAPAPPAQAPLATRTTPSGPDCSVLHCVALTFDDGPGPDTMTLLDELDAAGVKATFFVVGQNVHKHPDIVAAEIARGHDVGGHSWSHSYLTKMPPEQVAADTQQTSAAIANAGGTPPPFLRPPYGAKNQSVLDTIGMPAILWSVDTLDWQNRDVAQTTANALAGAQPGSIILFHDIHESTVQAIPGIVAELRARGLTPVTVTQLFAGQQLLPGHTYGSRSY